MEFSGATPSLIPSKQYTHRHTHSHTHTGSLLVSPSLLSAPLLYTTTTHTHTHTDHYQLPCLLLFVCCLCYISYSVTPLSCAAFTSLSLTPTFIVMGVDDYCYLLPPEIRCDVCALHEAVCTSVYLYLYLFLCVLCVCGQPRAF